MNAEKVGEKVQLAVDTSTRTASVALSRAGQTLGELTWQTGQSHGSQLIPAINRLLEHLGITFQDVDGIAVAKGPGSFNGLRVGMATAKGLAYSLDIPLVGVSTLEVEAYQHAASAMPLCPLHDAGRGELAAALFQYKDGCWNRLREEHITSPDALIGSTRRRTLFCGEVPSWARPVLEEGLGSKALFVGAAAALRRAGALAELGWKRLSIGDVDDVATLQPLYLRRPPAGE